MGRKRKQEDQVEEFIPQEEDNIVFPEEEAEEIEPDEEAMYDPPGMDMYPDELE